MMHIFLLFIIYILESPLHCISLEVGLVNCAYQLHYNFFHRNCIHDLLYRSSGILTAAREELHYIFVHRNGFLN
jgi:hypothetical protein